MIKVIHQFGVETDWVEQMAKGMGGYTEGNSIIVPEDVSTGSRYILSISPDITVQLADVTFHQDVSFKLSNCKNDFVGIYFNLSEGDSIHIIDEMTHTMGQWNFNLAIVDGQLDLQYLVKAGSKTYNICIFIKKRMLQEYLSNANILNKVLHRVFDSDQNTIIHYDRMSSVSWHMINEFKKIEKRDNSFDLFLSSLVYNLLGSCLENHILKKKIIIEKLDSSDVSRILASKSLMIDNVRDVFPGILQLSQGAFMSESKYKRLFLKITGITPNTFFTNNKLELAKDLLTSKQYSIGELVLLLNIKNASHFSKQFKSYFGMSPKEYTSLLS